MMKDYIVKLDNDTTFHITAKDDKEAHKQAEKSIANIPSDLPASKAKVAWVKEVEEPQPNATHEVREAGDDGRAKSYYFPAWGIEVVADSLQEAKGKIMAEHEKNVDEHVPPPIDPDAHKQRDINGNIIHKKG